MVEQRSLLTLLKNFFPKLNDLYVHNQCHDWIEGVLLVYWRLASFLPHTAEVFISRVYELSVSELSNFFCDFARYWTNTALNLVVVMGFLWQLKLNFCDNKNVWAHWDKSDFFIINHRKFFVSVPPRCFIFFAGIIFKEHCGLELFFMRFNMSLQFKLLGYWISVLFACEHRIICIDSTR